MSEFNLLFNLNLQDNHFTLIKRCLKMSDSCTIVSPFLADGLTKHFHQILGGKLKHIRLVTTLRGYGWEIARRIQGLREFNRRCVRNNIDLEILINNRLHSNIYLFKGNGRYFAGIISSANFTDPGLNTNIESGVMIRNRAFIEEIDRTLFSSFRFEELTEELMDDAESELGAKADESVPAATVEIDLESIIRKKKLFAEGSVQFRELIEKVDEYINSLKPESSRRTVLLFRWNTQPEHELTYEEIGMLLGVSKQRVSEIMISEIRNLKKHLAPVKERYEELFLNYLLINPEPVDLNPDGAFSYYFLPNFYHGVLSEVFEQVPFRDHLNRSFNQPSFSRSKSRTPLEKSIFNVLDTLEPGYKEITVQELLRFYFPDCTDTYSNLMALKMCISSSRFFFSRIDGEYYIMKDGRLEEMALEILKKSDIPLSSLEIYRIISNAYGKSYKTEDISTVSRLHNEGQKIGILRLDADLFGLEKHIIVPREKWEQIFDSARSIIRSKDRQTYVNEILEELPLELPELRSWYELGCILEFDKEIHSLGDYYYNLKGRQARKIEIRETVEEILRNENRAMGFNELFELVIRRRYATREGVKSVIEKLETVEETEGRYRTRDREEGQGTGDRGQGKESRTRDRRQETREGK